MEYSGIIITVRFAEPGEGELLYIGPYIEAGYVDPGYVDQE